MAISKYLRASLDRAAEIGSNLKRIESDENRKAMQLRHGTTSVYPGMFGELSAVIRIAEGDIASALRQVEHVERLERIASAFESLDIDLSDESLKALELLASERRYRHEQETLSEKIKEVIFDICEQERELEYQESCKSIEASGFTESADESDSNFTRGHESIRLGTDYRNDCTTYTWELYRKGVPIASGKSGEFSRLLSAISPAVQEVKA